MIFKFFIFLVGNYFIIITLKEPLDYLKLPLLITSKIRTCWQTQECIKLLLLQNSEIGEAIICSVTCVVWDWKCDLMGFVPRRKSSVRSVILLPLSLTSEFQNPSCLGQQKMHLSSHSQWTLFISINCGFTSYFTKHILFLALLGGIITKKNSLIFL